MALSPTRRSLRILTNSCSQIEFKVVRDIDGKSAVIVFAATCTRVRLRGEGRGTVSGDTRKACAELVLLDLQSRIDALENGVHGLLRSLVQRSLAAVLNLDSKTEVVSCGGLQQVRQNVDKILELVCTQRR